MIGVVEEEERREKEERVLCFLPFDVRGRAVLAEFGMNEICGVHKF